MGATAHAHNEMDESWRIAVHPSKTTTSTHRGVDIDAPRRAPAIVFFAMLIVAADIVLVTAKPLALTRFLPAAVGRQVRPCRRVLPAHRARSAVPPVHRHHSRVSVPESGRPDVRMWVNKRTDRY